MSVGPWSWGSYGILNSMGPLLTQANRIFSRCLKVNHHEARVLSRLAMIFKQSKCMWHPCYFGLCVRGWSNQGETIQDTLHSRNYLYTMRKSNDADPCLKFILAFVLPPHLPPFLPLSFPSSFTPSLPSFLPYPPLSGFYSVFLYIENTTALKRTGLLDMLLTSKCQVTLSFLTR